VTPSLTSRAFVFATVGIIAATAGLATGRPELVAVGAPFLTLLAVGLAAGRRATPTASITVTRPRVLEGDEIEITVAVHSTPSVRRVELRLGLPHGLEAVSASTGRVVGPSLVVMPAPAEVTIDVACNRWGVHELSNATMFWSDALGLVIGEVPMASSDAIKVLPRDETVRRLLRPLETQLAYGDLVSRQRGPGIEFSDLRDMAPGDDPRSINWRATARGMGWWVNDRHPERNSDVVLFVDALPEARRGVEATLDLAVRAIAGLARWHLRRHDRVGLVTFGEPVRWLQPGMGATQRYRILDALMEARKSHQLYWQGIAAIPRQAMPSKALIVALTPLLDDRVADAIADLGGRGLDIAVAAIDADIFLTEPQTDLEKMARRIWHLEREETRNRFTRRGVPVVRWDATAPFEQVMEEVERYRRHARYARA